MRGNQWFEEWDLKIKGTGELSLDDMNEMGYGESCLSYLHFAHTVCTGGRFFNEAVNEQGVPPDIYIIIACLYESFMLTDDQPNKLATSSCNFQLLE